MSTVSKTWVIIPLFNESKVIGDVVSHVQAIFPNIVCVDDGSSDDSANRALVAGAWVVSHPFNLGQGAALQTGLDFALQHFDAEYFVTFDADGQHAVEDALRMVNRLASEPLDVVVGSRFLYERAQIPLAKRILLRTVVSLENLTTGMKLTDAHNGLRAFNRIAARSLRITQNRMAHASEVTVQISKLGLRYSEEPVEIKYTTYSKSKGQSLWNSINILNDLWIK